MNSTGEPGDELAATEPLEPILCHQDMLTNLCAAVFRSYVNVSSITGVGLSCAGKASPAPDRSARVKICKTHLTAYYFLRRQEPDDYSWAS